MGLETYSSPEKGGKKENIKVLVRVRPLLPREAETEPVVNVIENENVINIDTDEHAVSAKFDGVFSGSVSQEDVYKCVKACSTSVVEGFNSTIFAYGQTGSGKTFTMFGPEDDLDIYSTSAPSKDMGIIPRAIRDILNDVATLRDQGEDITVYASFLQIYNDQPFDLLRDPLRIRPLQVHEDSRNGEIYVVGLSEYAVDTLHDCLALLEQGDEQRASRETRMNDVSSRSHSIFQLLLEKTKDNGTIIRSKLNLVDLAGSEKWGLMDNLEKAHISELTNINTSLHTLGRCIQALTEPNVSHVPFRDSKLTRILQDALGGNSRTCIIATLSPSIAFIEETISTLKFADRAKRVMQHARIVETRVIDLALVTKLEKQILSLKEALTKITGKSIPDTNLDEFLSQLEPSSSNNVIHNVPTIRNDFDESNDTPETDVHPGVIETMKKQMLYANKQVQRLEKELEQAKSKTNQSRVELINTDKSDSIHRLEAENRTLWKAFKSIKASANRFFKFEIEEEDFQVEFKRAVSVLKSMNVEESKLSPAETQNKHQNGSQSKIHNVGKTIPIHMPSIRKHFEKAKQKDDLRGRLRLAGNSIPERKVASSSKCRVRTRKTVSTNNVNEQDDTVPLEEDAETLLTKQLRMQKEKVAKHRRLQEWIAQKAERELEKIQAEKEHRLEQERLNKERNEKWKMRAKKTKIKLKKAKQQFEEVCSPRLYSSETDEADSIQSPTLYHLSLGEESNIGDDTLPLVSPEENSPISRQANTLTKRPISDSIKKTLDPHRPISRQTIFEDITISREQ